MNENISAYYKWLKADGRKFFVFSFLFHIFKIDAVNQGMQKVSFFWQPPWHPCVLELEPHDKYIFNSNFVVLIVFVDSFDSDLSAQQTDIYLVMKG